MRKSFLFLIILITVGFSARTRPMWEPKRPGLAELGMSLAGSTVASAVSWGGYLLWDWGSKSLAPDSWDRGLEITGQAGLSVLGYGLLIPTGASTGVTSVGILAKERKPSWGALVGGYAGSIAAAPFAYLVLDEPTWTRAGLAASSVIILPALGAWIGYQLTPAEPIDDAEASSSADIRIYPYLYSASGSLNTGFTVNF